MAGTGRKRFEVQVSEGASAQLRWLRANDKFASAAIYDAIDERLRFEADVPNRNRKRLRSGDWELRVQPYRIMYIVDRERGVVMITAITRKLREVGTPVDEA